MALFSILNPLEKLDLYALQRKVPSQFTPER